MERWLQSFWYQGAVPPWWTRPLSALFALIVRLRRAAYARGWLRSGRPACPVIVIGNITVGGTGKTPLTIWLVNELQSCGLRVGVVLRGYRGTAPGPLLLDDDTDAASAGDEAVLIRRRTGCQVAVDSNRLRAARLLEQADVQLIIADDGLQHLALQRDLEIAVIDGARGFGNGRLLPAGPLREPVSRLDSLALLVQNGGEFLRDPRALRMQLAAQPLRALAGAAAMPLEQLHGHAVHAVAAIGHPQRFFATLRAAGLSVREHGFPDHHRFNAAELQFGDALPVLMTEKDAVKCCAFTLPQHWYLPVTVQFAAHERQTLLGRVFMDARLLDILACPVCKGPLQHERAQSLLVCRADRLAFPIRDGVPVMLEEEARQLSSDDPLLDR